ncbi:methyl-accepting chemotaxis protein [Pseudoalteromonas sp.]|uniref:methyl-accepting chemotaxis protein n=1 Tax=Pseudoalteromonas sp. TaxID=53249 RepID=UPI00356A2838
MRVSSFTRLLLVVLSSISIALAVVLYWASQTINTLNQQTIAYNQLKNTIVVDLANSLQDYLSYGDNQFLTQAKNNISAVEQKLSILPNSISDTLQTQLNQLQQGIDGKYRALGKLSGNKNALIDHALNEMSDYASALSQYAEKAETSMSQQRFYVLANAYQTQVVKLSIALKENSLESTSSVLEDLARIASDIERLPLLGVFDPNVDQDELMLTGEEAEDLGEEIQAELLSLPNRLPKELENTKRLNDEREEGVSSLRGEIKNLTSSILAAEKQLRDEQAEIEQKVFYTLFVAVIALFLIAAIVYFTQRKQVLTPVRALRNAFSKLIENDNLEHIYTDNPKTEMGEIALYFNQLIEKQKQEAQERAETLQLVSDFLASMSDQLKLMLTASEQSISEVEQSEGLLSQLTEIGEQVSEINGTVKNNAELTFTAMENSVGQSESMLVASNETQQQVQFGMESMEQLLKGVNDVASVLEVINTIAEQTNLLALNAAIESARAGEHGRGFAVVADEVRQLAKQTQNSLQSIKQQLDGLGVSSQQVSQQMLELAENARQQTESATQMKENASNVAENALSASEVANQASNFALEQSNYLNAFSNAMQQLKSRVKDSNNQVQGIQTDLEQKMVQIRHSLGLQ